MSEFDLIQRYFSSRFANLKNHSAANVVLGIGDDCALLKPPENQTLAVSTDTMVDGVHFPYETAAEYVASRALSAALSDLAAMGAVPYWFTLALTLPKVDDQWLASFAQGLFDTAALYHCHLVGGDTSSGSLSVGIQVMGFVPPAQGIQRSGAKAGDVICVSGTLGDGGAGLAVAQNNLNVDSDSSQYLLNRFYRPKARIKLGQCLRGIATSALDVSDGLLSDVAHICRASGVGAVIDLEKLPQSTALKKSCAPMQAQHWALAGGDDYELCFTLPKAQLSELDKVVKQSGTSITQIGTVTKGRGVAVLQYGKPYKIEETGYEHFGR